jgi:hypothetical protein
LRPPHGTNNADVAITYSNLESLKNAKNGKIENFADPVLFSLFMDGTDMCKLLYHTQQLVTAYLEFNI